VAAATGLRADERCIIRRMGLMWRKALRFSAPQANATLVVSHHNRTDHWHASCSARGIAHPEESARPAIKHRIMLMPDEMEMLEALLRTGKSAARKQT